MTSRYRHDREQAKQKRALQAAQGLERAEVTTAAPELFGEPVRINPNNHDPVAEKAKNVLCDYDRFLNAPNTNLNELLGITRAPGTPQPRKGGKSQSSYFASPAPNGAHKNASHKFGVPTSGGLGEGQKGGSSGYSSSASRHGETSSKPGPDHRHSIKWPSASTIVRNSEVTTKSDRRRSHESGRPNKSESSPDKSRKTREKSADRHTNSKRRSTTPTKSGHGRSSTHKSPSSASLVHKDINIKLHNSKPGKDSLKPEPADLVKRLSPPVSPAHSSPKKTEQDVVTETLGTPTKKSPVKVEEFKMAPPNGTFPVNGLTKKHRQINLPKIRIQVEGKLPSDPSSSVDDIIKEMTRIDPPLTGISTPHKEKNFPFPSGHVDPPSRAQVTKQLMDSAIHKGGNGKTQGTILNDLELSDSESEGEDGKKSNQASKLVTAVKDIRSPKQRVRMSSSSDSESDGSSGSSSDSGSESESSASDGEEEAVAAPVEEAEEKVSPAKTPNSSTDQTSEQYKKPTWSLSSFIVPKATTGIIGSDIGLCDTLKDATDTGLGDLSDSLLKPTSKSNELITDLRADIDLPGHDSDFETHSRARQSKKDHKSTKHKHRSSSSADPQSNRSHRKTSETHSPGRSQTKSPVASVQETRTPTKPPASKKVSRKNSTATEKSQKGNSKGENHRTLKCKNGLQEDKLYGVSAKSSAKAGSATKPDGPRPRGRPKSKPKTPVLLSDSSDEEEKDVDVVSITPEKKSLEVLRKNSLDQSDVPEKIDFSTPPRNEVFKSSIAKQISPSQASYPPPLSSSIAGTKRKDSDRKDKKERKKHDKQSEDKRKPKTSPLSDKENAKFSNPDIKDIDIDNSDVVNESNFRVLSPIPSVPPKSIPGVSYLDGKPSVVVRLNFSLLDRIPPNMPKDTDLKSPESGISTMSSMSSNTCTAALSHTISGALDSTDSREDDGPPDLLTDSLNDSAVEDVGDTPRLDTPKLDTPKFSSSSASKHDANRASDVKTEVSKYAFASDTVTITSALGNSCVVKDSSGGPTTTTKGSVPDLSEEIIAQLWDSRPQQQKRKRTHPKDGGSEAKHPKPSPKTSKHSEPSPIRDNKSRDEKEGEVKSPSKTKERRSSSSSNSSHQSHKDKAKRRKCDKDSSIDKDKVVNVKEEVVDIKLKNGETDVHQTVSPCPNSHRVTARVGRMISHLRLLSAEEYLSEAKRLKHEADSLGDKKHRSLIYLEAVLSFILSGYAMEQEQICDSTRYFKMYTETLGLVKYTLMGRFRNNHHDNDGPNIEKQLTVLSLRIQSLLCLKLFKLKKPETLRLKKAIDDHNKISSKPTPSAPSPHQTSWNSRGTGTPSPMSPTPSPAGSIGSVGSQSSNCDVNPSKLANGNLSSGTVTPVCVNVPQRIHSITSQYISHTSYLVQAMDLWDQGDAASGECGDFFEKLELQTGALSLHSSIWELVHYVRQGLVLLKDT